MRGVALAVALWAITPASRADAQLHPLWELHGAHNTVYLLGSIHVLRPADYPLAPAILDAYALCRSLLMEIDLEDIDTRQLAAQMLAAAALPAGRSLPQILGPRRYAHAARLAHEAGVELSGFDNLAPWFAAEAISDRQLTALGFEPQSGVEMYFLGRARSDGKSVAGLETVQDQIALFQNLTFKEQAAYLESSLEDAHDLPAEVDDMVRAWQRGDTAWFTRQLRSELGHDPRLYQSLLAERNRRWVPKIEALLRENGNTLVIVGTLHLVGRGSLIELLRGRGVGTTQH